MDSDNNDDITEPESSDGASADQRANESEPGGAGVEQPLSKSIDTAATDHSSIEAGTATNPVQASQSRAGSLEEASPSLPFSGDNVVVSPEVPESVTVVGADNVSTILEEPTPTGDFGVGVPDLASQREAVLTQLFQAERPRPGQVLKATAPYADAVAVAVTAGLPLAEEVAALAAQVAKANLAALEGEREKERVAVERGKEHIANYERIFEKLADFAKNIEREAENMTEDDEIFKAAPEEVQSSLRNHKKGVEIILRMIERTIERKRNLEEPPSRVVNGFPPLGHPASVSEVAEHVSELCTAYHDARDGNYHILQAVEKDSERCYNQMVQALKSLLSAVDGIDSGLAHEAESRALVRIEDGEKRELEGLVSTWFTVYKRLDSHLCEFLDTTGIEPQTVERGAAFDPDRMEPTGTVSAPDLEEERVAAVSRRGFYLRGELIRPMSVEVVRNIG